jgi:hypothetical protein
MRDNVKNLFSYNSFNEPIVPRLDYDFFVFDSFFIKEKDGVFLLHRIVIESTKFEYIYGLSYTFEFQNIENPRVFRYNEKEFLSKDIRLESIEVVNDPRSNTTNYSNGKISLPKKSVYDFYTYFDFIVYVLEDKNIFIIESFRTDHTIIMIKKENSVLEENSILNLFLKRKDYLAKWNFISLELLEELRNSFFNKSISK